LTKEIVYVIVGPEFGDLEGHILWIHKALSGPCISGARWHGINFVILDSHLAKLILTYG
jgi:hypothetical protein